MGNIGITKKWKNMIGHVYFWFKVSSHQHLETPFQGFELWLLVSGQTETRSDEAGLIWCVLSLSLCVQIFRPLQHFGHTCRIPQIPRICRSVQRQQEAMARECLILDVGKLRSLVTDKWNHLWVTKTNLRLPDTRDLSNTLMVPWGESPVTGNPG